MSTDTGAPGLGNNSKAVLVNFVSAIETLEEQKADVAGEIKDKYAEAKAMGFDTKAMRTMIRRKRMDKQERDEMDAILETYEAALYSGAEGLV